MCLSPHHPLECLMTRNNGTCWKMDGHQKEMWAQTSWMLCMLFPYSGMRMPLVPICMTPSAFSSKSPRSDGGRVAFSCCAAALVPLRLSTWLPGGAAPCPGCPLLCCSSLLLAVNR